MSRRSVLAGGVAGAVLFVEAALASDPPAADAAALPPNNSPPNSNTIYPEDYGAKGDATTDDTSAIQACINAAYHAGDMTIQFGPKTYLVNGPFVTGQSGNAILPLPSYFYGGGTVRLCGAPGVGNNPQAPAANATTIRTTVTGKPYSSQYGTPSLIGGPTPEQMGRTMFSSYEIHIRDLTISTVANPGICGIDLSKIVRASVCNVNVYADQTGGDFAQPTSAFSFGIRLPEGLNGGDVIVEKTRVRGFYTGLVCNTSHTQIRSHASNRCYVGVGLTGSGQFASVDPHGTLIGYLDTEECTLHISGWSPTSGAINLATGNPFYVVVDLWDIEDGLPGKWYSTFAHLVDNNNQIHGRADYVRVKADSGVITGPLIAGGGSHLSRTDISA